MIDIKAKVDKFLKDFADSSETETLRKAVAVPKKAAFRDCELRVFKVAKRKLGEWFRCKLYSMGRDAKKVQAFHEEHDFGCEIGLAYSVEAKKDKINIGRYLAHLLLVLDSKDREIKRKDSEIYHTRQTYLYMEDTISRLLNSKRVDDKIKERFQQFYYLIEREED